MHTRSLCHQQASRATALLLSMALVAPVLVGCGGSRNSGANLPPVDDSRSGTVSSAPPPAQKTGMSTNKKIAILAGAAALYYLYKRSQNKKVEGAEGKYYLSKNGRVYYRDRDGRAHWVTPPQQMEVPQEELDRYPELSRYRGYNNRTSGEDFGALTQGQ